MTTLKPENATLCACLLSGHRLATVDCRDRIFVYDLQSGCQVMDWRVRLTDEESSEEDGCDQDPPYKIWSVPTPVATPLPHEYVVVGVSVDFDENGWTHAIHLYDPNTGALKHSLPSNPVSHLAVLSNGYFVSGLRG